MLTANRQFDFCSPAAQHDWDFSYLSKACLYQLCLGRLQRSVRAVPKPPRLVASAVQSDAKTAYLSPSHPCSTAFLEAYVQDIVENGRSFLSLLTT